MVGLGPINAIATVTTAAVVLASALTEEAKLSDLAAGIAAELLDSAGAVRTAGNFGDIAALLGLVPLLQLDLRKLVAGFPGTIDTASHPVAQTMLAPNKAIGKGWLDLLVAAAGSRGRATTVGGAVGPDA